MYKSKMGEYNFIDKINIDLRSVFKKRADNKNKKGYLNHLLMEYSLDYIANVIGLSEKRYTISIILFLIKMNGQAKK